MLDPDSQLSRDIHDRNRTRSTARLIASQIAVQSKTGELSEVLVEAALECGKVLVERAKVEGVTARELGALLSPLVALKKVDMDTLVKLAQLEQAAEGVATSVHRIEAMSEEDREAARRIAEAADTPRGFIGSDDG